MVLADFSCPANCENDITGWNDIGCRYITFTFKFGQECP